MIIESGLNLLHKVKMNKLPLTIAEEYTNIIKDSRTDTQLLYTKYEPKTKKLKFFLLYRITEIYNQLENDI